jgi:hypothetical protein
MNIRIITRIIVRFAGAGIVGCATLGEERAQVRSIAVHRVAAHELACAPADLAVDLDKDDGTTREWITGCNFKAIRVRCVRGNCSQVVERTWREAVYEEPLE